MQIPNTQSNEELIGQDVRVQVSRKEGCVVELRVISSKNLIEKARRAAIKKVNKEVSVSGFRKGKAPETMILQKYPNDVERTFHKELADLSFIEAQKLTNTPVLNNNARIIFDLKNQDENEAELTFTFETEPTPPTVDPKAFSPKPVERKEVGEKEINEAVLQMVFFYAKWEEIEDRPIQEGDFILIDLDTLEGENATRVFDQVRFEVKSERMSKWMQALVIGAKMGDVLEGTSEPDSDATEEEKKEFQPKKVRLYVKGVERAILPEIDDEFAKKVGSENVAKMHEMVEGILKKQIEDHAQKQMREQVNQFLTESYAFELPKSLIDVEFNHRLSQITTTPESQKQWEAMGETEKKRVEEKVRHEAVLSLKLFYLSKQVTQDAKISITHQDVQHMAVEHRKMQGMGMEAKGEISKEEFALALSTVLLSKTQDHIIEKQKA